jgi:hypothetical protein
MNRLITAAELKTALIANPNFDENIIKNIYIEEAQKMHLQPILGAELFNLVVITPSSYTALVSGETYNNGAYTVLYEGVKNFLFYATIYEAIPFIYMQLGKAGVFKGMVENSDRITPDELQFLRNIYLNKAGIESNFIMNYLNDNILTYPEYIGHTNTTLPKFYGGILL